MKGFVVSLILFLLTCLLITANAFYVHRVGAHVEQTAASVSLDNPASEEALRALEDYWERHHPFLALSIGYRELDRMSELLLSLRVAYDERSEVDFARERRLAIDTAADLARHERFSLENLF